MTKRITERELFGNGDRAALLAAVAGLVASRQDRFAEARVSKVLE